MNTPAVVSAAISVISRVATPSGRICAPAVCARKQLALSLVLGWASIVIRSFGVALGTAPAVMPRQKEPFEDSVLFVVRLFVPLMKGMKILLLPCQRWTMIL